MSDAMYSYEFLAGQTACRDGEDCPDNADDNFKQGYDMEYQRGAINDNKSGEWAA